MRWLVLGLDALEYDLVERFGLKNLMQEEYGRTNLDDFEVILTYPIWVSFITGLKPEEHGAKGFWQSTDRLRHLFHVIGLGEDITNKMADKFLQMVKFLAYKTSNRKEIESFLRYFLSYERADQALAKRGVKTIFDVVDKSHAINVVGYNYLWDYHRGNLLRKAIEDPDRFERKFEKYIYYDFLKEKASFLDAIKNRAWNLVMGYTRMADDLGHSFGGDLAKTSKIYTLLDNYAEEVRELMSEDDVLLIVSDHGMKPLGRYGEHSDHGFYSCSKRLNLSNPRVYDFFSVIVNGLQKS
jgi:predicted AlkP superfamily pyrophosphatase or phosphodiesterase